MKSTYYQLAQAHKKIFMDGVLEVQEGIYHVQSATNKDQVYLVVKVPKGYECSCDGFKYRGHCSHITSIRLYRRNYPLKEKCKVAD